MGKTYTKRDQNIQKSFKRELDLNTKSVSSKKAYKRKEKYKNDRYSSDEL